jgi:hypothetical protein
MLADYANDILDSKDKRLVQIHIAECNSCRNELDKLLKVLNLIDDVKVEYPPASIWERFIPDLHKRIESEVAFTLTNQRKKQFYLATGWIASIAIIAMIIFASTMLQNKISRTPDQFLKSENGAMWNETSKENLSNSIEESSERELVAGLISQVLITDSEAVELKKLKNFIQSDVLTLQYNYDDVLDDLNSEIKSKSNEEGVIEFLLENEFVEFSEGSMMDSEIVGLGKM